MYNQELSKEGLNDKDLVVLATGHDDLDWPMVLKESKSIFDTRHILKGQAELDEHKGKVTFL